jgi:hypothetical protein
VNRHESFTCPDCHKKNTVKGSQSFLLCCYNCGQVLADATSKGIRAKPVPEDFSIVQIGTTGTYKTKSFEVIGQIRMQLRREYKMLWFVWYQIDDTYGWLSEAYSHFAMCPAWTYPYTEKELVFGESAKISDKLTIVPSYFDQCEDVTYGGELKRWDYLSAGFTLAAGGNQNVECLFFAYPAVGNIQFLVGEVVQLDALELKQIREFNEWNG